MSGGIGGGWLIDRLLVLVGILSKSVHNLNTHLLGQGQLDGLTGGGSKLGDALLKGLNNILNLGDGDTLFSGQILTGDSGQRDGLVDTGLDGLGVGDLDGGIDNGDNRDVVASLLGDLLAVVVSVSTISVSRVVSGLAHGNHLGGALLGEADLNSLGGGVLRLGLVGVGADLVVNLLDGFRADSSGDGVALLNINDGLAGHINGLADGLESWGADLGGLNNITDGAVVLGVVVGRGVVVSRGRVVIGSRCVIGRGGVVSRGGRMVDRAVIAWAVVVGGGSVEYMGHGRAATGQRNQS